jgi:hypothetical protein
VLRTDALEVLYKVVLHDHGQRGCAIDVSLAPPNDKLVPGEINVLDTQPAALEEAQPRSIQQRCHQPRHSGHAAEDGAHLVTGEHDWKSPWRRRSDEAVEPGQVTAENLAIKKEQRSQRLVLSRRRDTE